MSTIRTIFVSTLLMALTGCLSSSLTTLRNFRLPMEFAEPSINTVMVAWDSRVHFAFDNLHGGRPYPVLAGRLFLMNAATNKPCVARGEVIVDIYDASPNVSTENAKPSRVSLPNEALEKLMRKDMVGEGYTVALPWFEYRPEISRVKLNLCFIPEGGQAIYAEPAYVTLRADNPIPIRNEQVRVGAAKSQ